MERALQIEEILSELKVNMKYVEFFLSETLDITTNELFIETAQRHAEMDTCNMNDELYYNFISLKNMNVTVKALKQFIESIEDEEDDDTYSLHGIFYTCQYYNILNNLTKNRVDYMLATCLQYMKENLEMTEISEKELGLLKDYIIISEPLDKVVKWYINFVEESIKPTVSKTTLQSILNKDLSKEEIIEELKKLAE